MAIVLNELQHSQIEEKSSSKLQAFQRKIYLKAKLNPKYKFYCLYDKVFRTDVLNEAYQRVKANQGSPGMDNVSFKDLADQEENFLKAIQAELKTDTYHPAPLKEVQIPKSNGKMRTLKIPTIKDRVVQMAVKLVIEPIFEAGFLPNSYGYRPKKSAQQAIGVLIKQLFPNLYKSKQQQTKVQSLDLSDCFNTIPHKELLQLVASRIIDRKLLSLIKVFLKAGTMDMEKNQNDTGTPQGGVISPLLANIYLNQVDRYWQGKTTTSKLIRYADDMVVLLHPKEEQLFSQFLHYLEQDLKLKVNREKSQEENLEQGV